MQQLIIEPIGRFPTRSTNKKRSSTNLEDERLKAASWYHRHLSFRKTFVGSSRT